jgi:hypothetical protein
MKKIIFLLFAVITSISPTYSQKKNYISVEYGITVSGMSNSIANNMKTDGFGDKLTFGFIPTLFDALNGDCRQYPLKDPRKANYKFRYGYNIKNNASIETGFGLVYRSTVKGADAIESSVNYLDIKSKISTVYAAYMWKTKKANAAIGFGPAVSFCSIKQGTPDAEKPLSDKSYVLPGVIFTGYWNFVNNKSWFMGLRSDMTITTSAKTEEVKVINPAKKSIVSVSKSNAVGSVMNSISISVGIKF